MPNKKNKRHPATTLIQQVVSQKNVTQQVRFWINTERRNHYELINNSFQIRCSVPQPLQEALKTRQFDRSMKKVLANKIIELIYKTIQVNPLRFMGVMNPRSIEVVTTFTKGRSELRFTVICHEPVHWPDSERAAEIALAMMTLSMIVKKSVATMLKTPLAHYKYKRVRSLI